MMLFTKVSAHSTLPSFREPLVLRIIGLQATLFLSIIRFNDPNFLVVCNVITCKISGLDMVESVQSITLFPFKFSTFQFAVCKAYANGRVIALDGDTKNSTYSLVLRVL